LAIAGVVEMLTAIALLATLVAVDALVTAVAASALDTAAVVMVLIVVAGSCTPLLHPPKSVMP
jgi:hypothetical protein